MHRITFVLLVTLLLVATLSAQSRNESATYIGFDRNQYPGDDKLASLRATFAFSGYWLNNPPGESRNSWSGKRGKLQSAGFGFLVLFNGRTYKQIRSGQPADMGKQDGRAAVESARREGFPKATIIFLDQEEGGRLLPEQRNYLHAWLDTVTASGYRTGVYCSGVPFIEGDGTRVITAEDIRQNAGGRKIVFWVSNDACGPSPGCVVGHPHPAPGVSGVPFAEVWQYAQSPRRPEMTAKCAKSYAADGDCYAPGGRQFRLHLDINSARSSDPSRGRDR